MVRKTLLIPIVVVMLVTMACGVNISLPKTQLKTGPTQTKDISVPLPGTPEETTFVTLAFGAGELSLSPGAENALISGTATYNVEDFEPQVTVNGNRVRVEQGDLEIEGIPNFSDDVRNEWVLALGSSPMSLNINAGAYKGEIELGGLALEDLEISDGASEVELSFSEPNQIVMDTFEYSTGASSVTMNDLSNANFQNMEFRCGAGSYKLDFGGELERDAEVRIDAGISNIEIVVPEGVSARVSFDGTLSNVDTHGDWQRSGDEYVLEGSGPVLTIVAKMGAGSLDLSN